MADLLALQFTDADKAREHLEDLRWPDGPVCPHCGVVGDHYRLAGEAHRPGLLKCKDCRKQFSVTVGTVFADSKVPLNKWLLAVNLMCANKKGLSAHSIHRMLGITYKTAWFMCHRIREAMRPRSTAPLGSGGGMVEADETYWGNNGKQRKGARGYKHKIKVLSLVERGGDKRSFVVPHVNGKTLRPILKPQIAARTHLMTDEHGAYYHVGKEFASHQIANHNAGEYASGNVTTNTVESSFSLLKRALIGAWQHVGEHHLQRNVTEADFGWNNRRICDSKRADLLLSRVAGRRLTYRHTS